jgi:hypothetical protein
MPSPGLSGQRGQVLGKFWASKSAYEQAMGKKGNFYAKKFSKGFFL